MGCEITFVGHVLHEVLKLLLDTWNLLQIAVGIFGGFHLQGVGALDKVDASLV